MIGKPRYVCPKCGCMHARRNLAVECCSSSENLTIRELEAIGQERLFDDGEVERLPEFEPNGQATLF